MGGGEIWHRIDTKEGNKTLKQDVMPLAHGRGHEPRNAALGSRQRPGNRLPSRASEGSETDYTLILTQ